MVPHSAFENTLYPKLRRNLPLVSMGRHRRSKRRNSCKRLLLTTLSVAFLITAIIRFMLFVQWSPHQKGLRETSSSNISENEAEKMRGNHGYHYIRDGVRNIAEDVVHGGGNDGGRRGGSSVSVQQAESAAREPLESRGGNHAVQKVQHRLPWWPGTHSVTAGEGRIPIVGKEPYEPAGEGSLKQEKWGTGKRVLIFTMDSLAKFVAAAARGGPAGEIKIRESLTTSLTEAGVQVDIAVSDKDFEKKGPTLNKYQAIVLDPWTWAGKGWRLKSQLKGLEKQIFVMDFFGSETPHKNLPVPTQRFLTAFPTPAERAHTFLGYRMDSSISAIPPARVQKKQQGIIWGKTLKTLHGKATRQVIARLAEEMELHSTVSLKDAKKMKLHQNVIFHGMLSSQEWHQLLQESKFMIGLGHPLSGPSAVDAVARGCMYINPTYSKAQKGFYQSQHPYLQHTLGEPYVCSYNHLDPEGAFACARKALEQDLEPIVPHDLSEDAHRRRVRAIFEPVLGR